jgi:TIR domain
MSEYVHDVFISYSHRDKAWVDGVLVPALRENKLRVLTDDAFELGLSAIENMSNAVKTSRRIVVVLTPEWVNSEWTTYEAILTAYVDPSGAQRRIIPIMRRACEPPQWIGFRTRIDLVDDTQLVAQMERLVRALAAAPVELVQLDAVNQSLRTVADLLRAGPVRDALLEFRVLFGAAVENIERLTALKDLHDQLHELQLQCYDQILGEAADLEAGSDTAVENLETHADTLDTILTRLRELQATPALGAMTLAWLPKLERAQQMLGPAIAAADPAQVRRAAAQIDRVLASEPAAIDALLNHAARDLQLAAIINAVDLACRRAEESKMEPGRLGELQQGLAALRQLESNLQTLVSDHGSWQRADVDLRRVYTSLASDPDELIDSWPDLKAQFATLAATDEPWALTLRQDQQHIEAAIGENDLTGMRRHFRHFRREAIKRFYQVDKRLKRQCDELRKAGEPLAAIVRVLA